MRHAWKQPTAAIASVATFTHKSAVNIVSGSPVMTPGNSSSAAMTNRPMPGRSPSVSGWTPYQVWDKYPEQESALIQLQKGRRYYIEVLHKQGDLKENLSIAWQAPGGTREVIGGQYLSPWSR
jgi:hypothetical protein